MSAFSVSTAHLDYLVTAAYRYGCLKQVTPHFSPFLTDYDVATKVLRMLRAENNASLAARYPSHPDMQSALEDDDEATLRGEPDPVQVLKAVNCYAYQACEHDGWEASEARKFCERLKACAIANLPGYREAAWEVT